MRQKAISIGCSHHRRVEICEVLDRLVNVHIQIIGLHMPGAGNDLRGLVLMGHFGNESLGVRPGKRFASHNTYLVAPEEVITN